MELPRTKYPDLSHAIDNQMAEAACQKQRSLQKSETQRFLSDFAYFAIFVVEAGAQMGDNSIAADQ